MRAIVYKEYGAPDVLRLVERAKPEPGATELLVRVHAAEATKADCELRSFRFPVKWFSWPLRLVMGVRKPRREILGGYFSGTIERVGGRVTRFAPGDAVFGSCGLKMGAYAHYMTLPSRFTIAPKPRSMSFQEAAAVPLGGLNALHFIRKSRLRAGERILINGAGGSIGTFALQIAKSRGAHITAVDAPHKEAMLRELGADDFIDYTQRDFAAEGARYDVLFDVVASSSFKNCMTVLTKEGRYLTANPTLKKMVQATFTHLFSKKTAHFAFAGETQEELETLRELVEAGAIRAPIDQVLPLREAQEAHRRVESEERRGVVVLSHTEDD